MPILIACGELEKRLLVVNHKLDILAALVGKEVETWQQFLGGAAKNITAFLVEKSRIEGVSAFAIVVAEEQHRVAATLDGKRDAIILLGGIDGNQRHAEEEKNK